MSKTLSDHLAFPVKSKRLFSADKSNGAFDLVKGDSWEKIHPTNKIPHQGMQSVFLFGLSIESFIF